MPRPLRIEYSGAWYHVMNRGANHNDIFHKTKHFREFLALLEATTIKFKIEVHAYCLMRNHYHLLIYTPIPNLGKAMRYLDGVYTQRYNRLQLKDGPLFRGRYKAILLDSNEYLLRVSRYIHLNPVEARLCKHPLQYAWSSYHAYLTDKPEWVFTSAIKKLIGSFAWRNIYMNFVSAGIDSELQDFYARAHTPSILGNAEFKNIHLENIHPIRKKEFSTDINHIKQFPKLSIIVKAVMHYYQVNENILTLKNKGKKNIPRLTAIYLAHLMSQSTHLIIAKYFNLERVSISSVIARAQHLVHTDKQFKQDITNIICKINAQHIR